MFGLLSILYCIAPDVTNISRDLTAEVVNLQPLQVRVSFPVSKHS